MICFYFHRLSIKPFHKILELVSLCVYEDQGISIRSSFKRLFRFLYKGRSHTKYSQIHILSRTSHRSCSRSPTLSASTAWDSLALSPLLRNLWTQKHRFLCLRCVLVDRIWPARNLFSSKSIYRLPDISLLILGLENSCCSRNANTKQKAL